MPTTPTYGLRYPSLADAPNGPDAVQDLAEDVESTLSTLAPISTATVNAKGDLLAGTANDAISRLAVGSDGEVLTADSGAPTGLTWATPATVAASSASVATGEATSSESFTDLTTPGPAVTVDVGPQGVAIVSVTARVEAHMEDETGGEDYYGVATFALSGANTLAASQARAIQSNSWIISTDGDWLTTHVRASGVFVLTGLNPGSTTFTMKYAMFDVIGNGGSADFSNREIGVVTF
jgi:hypothetical protein